MRAAFKLRSRSIFYGRIITIGSLVFCSSLLGQDNNRAAAENEQNQRSWNLLQGQLRHATGGDRIHLVEKWIDQNRIGNSLGHTDVQTSQKSQKIKGEERIASIEMILRSYEQGKATHATSSGGTRSMAGGTSDFMSVLNLTSGNAGASMNFAKKSATLSPLVRIAVVEAVVEQFLKNRKN
jgi:hypothetical protein